MGLLSQACRAAHGGGLRGCGVRATRVGLAVGFIVLAGLASGPGCSAGEWIPESARRLPLVGSADVIVCGGSAGAVSAAVAAARSGAKSVWLLAPRPYLGESMCRTLRLWREPGEKPRTPLERALFADPALRRGLAFTYRADRPSAAPHRDSRPPSRLTDGEWASAFTQSIQYNGDVALFIDLGKKQALRELRIYHFQADHDFAVAGAAVAVSVDGKNWTAVGRAKNLELGKGRWVESPLMLRIPLSASARYLRLRVFRAPGARRLLLGEVQVFSRDGAAGDSTGVTLIPPMQVKGVLEKALVRAKVRFLYGAIPTGVLCDGAGRPAGVVFVDRAGRHALAGKVIIDAGEWAVAARAAGARFLPRRPRGEWSFRRYVLGGRPHSVSKGAWRLIPLRCQLGGLHPAGYGSGGGFTRAVMRRNRAMEQRVNAVIEYTFRWSCPEFSLPGLARIEQEARDCSFDPEALDASEHLAYLPPEQLAARARAAGDWPGAERAALDWFRPRKVARLYVLGPCAGVSRAMAAALSRPLESMRLGRRIGEAAAAESARIGPLHGLRAAVGEAPVGRERGEVRELLRGLRGWERGGRCSSVPAAAGGLPVFGRYDVVVVGGGTSGAPAAVAAARAGARTLVIEYLDQLGGVGTAGEIGLYCAGMRRGFTAEVDRGIAALHGAVYVRAKAEWWRRAIRGAGGEIWFGVLGCGALVRRGRVCGVVVAGPRGRGVVLAQCVVDATGNGDIAVAAGAQALTIGAETVARQGAGLPPRPLGASYVNTDWTYVIETDRVDAATARAAAHQRYSTAWDLAELIDTRERRRVLGDMILSPLDIVNHRVFPDTIAMAQGGRLDKHGFTIHPYYFINNYRGGISYTPYRCLLPRGLDGILVVGLAVSAHVDAIPSIRMQPDMQNLGYAAGRAAARAAKNGGHTRSIDLQALQKHLLKIGCLTPEAAAGRDSFPISSRRVDEAVQRLISKDYQSLGTIMAAWGRARSKLVAAVQAAPTAAGRLRCAHVLGILGDPAGFDLLAQKVRNSAGFDTGNIDTYFPCITWLDSYIIALGRTRDSRALPIVLDKLALLGRGKGSAFSHYRAVCEALQTLGDPRAAEPLAALLRRSGGADRAVSPAAVLGGRPRGKAGLRNLIIARTLYRCGDWKGLGRAVLEVYARDARGVFAAHARAVLAHRPGAPLRPPHWLGL